MLTLASIAFDLYRLSEQRSAAVHYILHPPLNDREAVEGYIVPKDAWCRGPTLGWRVDTAVDLRPFWRRPAKNFCGYIFIWVDFEQRTEGRVLDCIAPAAWNNRSYTTYSECVHNANIWLAFTHCPRSTANLCLAIGCQRGA